MGVTAENLAERMSHLPRGAGRVRRRVAPPRRGRAGGRDVRRRDRPGAGEGQARDGRLRARRAHPPRRRRRVDGQAHADLQEGGRHGHRRQRVGHERRRRGGRADDRGEGAGARRAGARADPRATGICGVDPEVMGIGPVPAVRKVLEKAGRSLDEVGVIELNEAFAAQALAVIRSSTSTRRRSTRTAARSRSATRSPRPARSSPPRAWREMEREDHELGLVTLCIGGGQGIALLLAARGVDGRSCACSSSPRRSRRRRRGPLGAARARTSRAPRSSSSRPRDEQSRLKFWVSDVDDAIADAAGRRARDGRRAALRGRARARGGRRGRPAPGHPGRARHVPGRPDRRHRRSGGRPSRRARSSTSRSRALSPRSRPARLRGRAGRPPTVCCSVERVSCFGRHLSCLRAFSVLMSTGTRAALTHVASAGRKGMRDDDLGGRVDGEVGHRDAVPVQRVGEVAHRDLAVAGEVVDARLALAEHRGLQRAGHVVVVDELERHAGVGDHRLEDRDLVEQRPDRRPAASRRSARRGSRR